MDRRRFLKRCAFLGAGLTVAPKLALDRLVYADFEPGQTYRLYIRIPEASKRKEFALPNPSKTRGRFPHFQWGKCDHRACEFLKQLLKTKIPPAYRHGDIEYRSKVFDYGHALDARVRYQAPTKPLK